MAKWHGSIGYVLTVEYERGSWEEQVVERSYYGDVIRNTRRLQTSSDVNDSVVVSNQISIIADPFATQNIYGMKYATFMGAKWKITNATVQYPRIVLDLGGVYNGQQT